jgi:hypothetical protein
MQKNFLSIDLDYFNDVPAEEFYKVLDYVFSLRCPVVVEESHEELLEYFPGYSTLINLDMHSDYAAHCKEDKPDIADCGNWVDYTGVKEYIWVPSNIAQLRCDHYHNVVFEQLPGSIPILKKRINWRKVLGSYNIAMIGFSTSMQDMYTDLDVFLSLRESKHWKEFYNCGSENWQHKFANKFYLPKESVQWLNIPEWEKEFESIAEVVCYS